MAEPDTRLAANADRTLVDPASLAQIPGIGMLVAKPNPDYDGSDPATEGETYARSVLSDERRKAIEEELRELGPMSTEQVHDLLNQNTTSRFTPDGVFVLDGELLMEIDVRLREPVFVLEDNTIHTREELLNTYPFAVFKMKPEDVFAQQEVGIFAARESSLDKAIKDYLVRDLGSEDEFVLFEDMIGRWARKDKHVDRRPVEKVVKTKIFLARDGWDDFMKVVHDFRAKQRILGLALRRGAAPALAHLMNFGVDFAALGAAPAVPMLQSSEDHAAALAKKEEELAAKQAEIERREAEIERQAEEIAALIGSLNP